MKKIMKRVCSCFIMIVILLSSTITSMAVNQNSDKNVKVLSITDNSMTILEDGNIGTIEVVEDDSYRYVNVIEDGKIVSTFTVDKVANTIHSSITNKTNELKGIEYLASKAAGSDFYHDAIKTSYAEIADGIGSAINVINIVAYILACSTFNPANIEMVDVLGDVIETGWDIVSASIKNNTSGGIVTVIWMSPREVVKQGKVYIVNVPYVKHAYTYR